MPDAPATPADAVHPDAPAADYSVVVIGAGPAGLGAALNIVRARHRTLVLDANRPRNAATLHSHGYPTRDGISPLELRRLGRAELEQYPEAEFENARVTRVSREGEVFRVEAQGIRGGADRSVTAVSVVVTSGLVERLPALPTLRAFYGTALHSCVMCDGYEESGKPLALIGETDDLAEHARLLSRWTDDLIVFGPVGEQDERELAGRGVRVERRPVADVVGDRSGMTGILLEDGETVPRTAGFVRPVYEPALAYLDGLDAAVDDDGLLVVDGEGRTSVPGLYAAGDSTPPGPQQLIVAAGSGAKVAAALVRDRL
ncbi:NAD(P)/FAD-dependent oxidoreductase [Naasia sp. SYSU D00057]|uniref:NAD(P)/FAD-dependent oxidoreductase n=1 Tax=Naasia sp. SYSU D00057 TaxID=2817380 RepID=UPI001B303AE1|nr:NAD(P)/FAD-dependent oxidoreductase [Naasia sp. SYSU D00057]